MGVVRWVWVWGGCVVSVSECGEVVVGVVRWEMGLGVERWVWVWGGGCGC